MLFDRWQRIKGKVPRMALAAAMSAGLVAFMGGPVLAGSASAATRGTAAPATETAGLRAAYAAYRHIPVSDVGGIVRGSVHAATVGGIEWATASFTPARAASPAIKNAFQDGGSIGVFTRRGHAPWTMRTIGGEPFPCGSVVPAAVRTAWGLPTPAECGPAVKAAPRMPVRAASGTTASIASIALSQVGRGDTPASTHWDLDCDAYTALLGVGASNAGCGTDPNFGVVDQNELWCSDFAKWVWEQAGVSADLAALNAGATSFATWAQDEGESTAFDSGTPAVGDAVVFYQAGTGTAVGSTANHVGLIVGVDSSNGTVDLVNGDFMGSANITVQDSGYVNLQSFANAVWGAGEEWVLVSPKLPSTTSVDEVAFQAAGTGHLYTYNASTGASTDANLGMAAGTSPAIAADSSGDFEVAFQANTDHLYTYNPQTKGHVDANLGMAAGTSPAIAALSGGGFEVAFQANTGRLYTYDTATASSVNTNLGVASGTSPSITASPGGGFEVTFQAAGTGHLYTYNTATGASTDANLGMAAGTSPAITRGNSGLEVAFQANNGHLYTYDPQANSHADTNLGMAAGTSPAITASPSGGFEVTFQAGGTGHLYFYNTATGASTDANLGMAAGTSPAIAASNGLEMALQANTDHLFTYNPQTNGHVDANLGMAAGTSPAIAAS